MQNAESDADRGDRNKSEEGKNLLLDLFQGKTVVIPHPNEFLDLLILLCGNMHRTVIMVRKASGDYGCVALICFDSLFPHGTGMLVGARITHFTLCAVNSWYSVKPRHPAS